MQHPEFYLARVTKFLDFMIQEYGDYLFIELTFLSLLLIAWIFTRRRRHPMHDISVVILPLGQAPKREPEPRPLLFEDSSSF